MNTELRTKVYNKYIGKCAYCGKSITYTEMQVDHAFPQARKHWLKSDVMREKEGLDFTDINDFKNLMPTCRRCNHYKRAATIKEFKGELLTLHQRIGDNYINKVGLDYGMLTLKPFDGVFYFESIRSKKC